MMKGSCIKGGGLGNYHHPGACHPLYHFTFHISQCVIHILYLSMYTPGPTFNVRLIWGLRGVAESWHPPTADMYSITLRSKFHKQPFPG